MTRQSVSILSKRGLTLKVLSKLLYAITDNSINSEELKDIHQKVLNASLMQNEVVSDSKKDPFNIADIPWERILDAIANNNPFLRKFIEANTFSAQELRYMCAMFCGLSGKEYELITRFKSQYNLSWSIRQKIGMRPKTTNLRKFLQKLSEDSTSESLNNNVPK